MRKKMLLSNGILKLSILLIIISLLIILSVAIAINALDQLPEPYELGYVDGYKSGVYDRESETYPSPLIITKGGEQYHEGYVDGYIDGYKGREPRVPLNKSEQSELFNNVLGCITPITFILIVIWNIILYGIIKKRNKLMIENNEDLYPNSQG